MVYSPPWQPSARTARKSMSRADWRLEELRPHIEEARRAGCVSLREIAAFLNANGLCTTRGRQWGASQVLRALARLNSASARSANGEAPLSPEQIQMHVQLARTAGYRSLREIAAYFDAQGIRTVRGRRWGAMQVRRMLRRLRDEAVPIDRPDKRRA